MENEYGNIEAAFGEKGKSYVRWAVQMGLDLQTGVPWIMCKQPDAPDPVVCLPPDPNLIYIQFQYFLGRY